MMSRIKKILSSLSSWRIYWKRCGGHLRAIEAKHTFLGDLKERRVLDLGGGDSLWALGFSQKGGEVCVIDINPELLRNFRTKYENQDINLVIADAERLPFKNESFDVVHASGCLHHLPHLEQGIEESHRVLRNGGKFFASDPNLFNLPAAIARRLFFKRSLDPGERRLSPFALGKIVSHYYESYSIKTFYPLFSYLVPYLEDRLVSNGKYFGFKVPSIFKKSLDLIDKFLEKLPLCMNFGALIETFGQKYTSSKQ